ncbi:hypothetical protein [Klenkia taihuensis]|uniref:Uncharacterized protein n=1 Tax=Klenkia taihuensis TaxID=1225127 RepID=A0A1I1SBJ2_9ACTN|nr:hypothetical protein [Klenkia taihuensis]GHE13658.1 hypothetical protein GCM10011381_36900 [Klenkia taihuensis]SFD41978.1 hypothetical protein SAMN05661030_3274 [Klenkia taihuensis]
MRRASRRPDPHATRALAGLVALPLSLTLLSGCWLPDVSMSPDVQGASATASSTSAPTATSATSAAEPAAATADRPSGDLDAGSVTHVQPAGDRDLVIDYWTTQQAVDWTPADTKSIQLSAHLEGEEATATSIEVLVTRFSAVLDDGTTRTTVVDDRGEFALQPPFTYGTAVELPPTDPAVDAVTVTVQFDLLVETGRNTDRYYRQTVIDTLELPLLTQETDR